MYKPGSSAKIISRDTDITRIFPARWICLLGETLARKKKEKKRHVYEDCQAKCRPCLHHGHDNAFDTIACLPTWIACTPEKIAISFKTMCGFVNVLYQTIRAGPQRNMTTRKAHTYALRVGLASLKSLLKQNCSIVTAVLAVERSPVSGSIFFAAYSSLCCRHWRSTKKHMLHLNFLVMLIVLWFIHTFQVLFHHICFTHHSMDMFRFDARLNWSSDAQPLSATKLKISNQMSSVAHGLLHGPIENCSFQYILKSSSNHLSLIELVP